MIEPLGTEKISGVIATVPEAPGKKPEAFVSSNQTRWTLLDYQSVRACCTGLVFSTICTNEPLISFHAS